MEILYGLLLALANNADTVSVRVAYSLKGIRVPFGINLWIGFIAFTVSLVAAGSGQLLADWLPGKLGNVLSMVFLVTIGLWLIAEPYVSKKRRASTQGVNMLSLLADPVEADLDQSKHIDFKEATLLGLALSLNNVGGGLSGGILGINPFLIGFLSALFSILIFWMGNRLIGLVREWNLGYKAPLMAGLLIIVLGIKRVL